MPKRDETSQTLQSSLKAPADCSIRTIGDIARSARAQLEAGQGIHIDCASVEQADITFVQLIVSAERSFAARGLPLTIEAAPAAVLSAFARAGVALPGAAPFESPRN